MRLKNKVAIVTGAGAGIGRAIACRLAEEEANIVALDIDTDNLDDLTRIIEGLGRTCLPLKADVTDADEVAEMVKKALARFGKVDILVNNAGGSPGVTSQTGGFKLDEKIWDEAYALNLKSQMIVTSLVLPHMKDRRQGKIINIASGSAKLGDFHRIAYGSAKAGVISMTRALARELGKENINVNSVCPGPTWTPQWEREGAYLIANIPAYSGLTPRQLYEQFVIKTTALGKTLDPKDTANVVVFLASDDASAITGQSLNVDGGQAFD